MAPSKPTRSFGVPTVDIEGYSFLDVDEAGFVELLVRESRAGRGGWVITPNTDILRLAHADPDVRALLDEADVLVADGMPLIWASRVQRTPLSHGRICGSDLVFSLPAAAAAAGLSVYLLGGADDTAEQTARVLVERSPSLRIAGTYSPPFGFESRPELYEHMESLLRAAEPDIVFVALSVPKGERLIRRLRGVVPKAWWLGVGAAFDFATGRFQRAPAWMQGVGMEWAFRMVHDPKRLVRRYLWHDVPYAGQLFAHALRRRYDR